MAARLRPRHQDEIRQKIKVSNILTRLQKHVDGEVEMTPAQVTSAKILLDKSMSNAPEEGNFEHKHEVVVRWQSEKS